MTSNKLMCSVEVDILDFEIIKELIGIVNEIIRVDGFIHPHTKVIDPEWWELRDDIRDRLYKLEDKYYSSRED